MLPRSKRVAKKTRQLIHNFRNDDIATAAVAVSPPPAYRSKGVYKNQKEILRRVLGIGLPPLLGKKGSAP